MAEAKESKSNTKIEPEAAAPKPTPVVLTAAQIISADIDALNNFDKVKESLIPNSSINYGFSVKDTELGIRITRHLKILKVLATFSDVRALYSGFLNETAPGAIQSAAETTPEFTFDRSLAISKPSRIYVHTLALLLLKKQKHFQEVDQTVLHQCVPLSVAVLEQVSQSEVWYLDSLWGFIYGLYARIHELNNQLQHVRVRLFEIYRLSTVSKRETSQAVLLNLILRCFIVSNDFAGASEFINQTMFPEGRINNEFVKYLYYTAFIKAIELDYHDAHARVGQALRKAPEKAAVGFKLAAQKLSIVVEMLLGEVPSRNLFTEGELSGYLFPYYELVRTLVKGDVAAFDKACSKNRATFEKDGLLVLINRLTLNVIRAGLKKIHLSYSRISFADIAIKLSLPATTDVENLISKAIRDQVLTGTIDVHKQELIMNDNNDTYGTSIPQLNYQKRIDFCTMIINNCSKALAQEPTKKKNKDASDMDEFEKLLAEFEDPFF